MWTVELIIMLLMVAMNSVFAGYEIALASVSAARLHRLEQERQRGAAAAARMKRNMEGSLAVVQLGITLFGAVAAATGGAGAHESLEPAFEAMGLSRTAAELLSIAVVVLPLTVVTIIFGELVPKVFALRNTEWVVLTLSPWMEWFALAVRPAVWFFERSVTWIMLWGERAWKPGTAGSSEQTNLQELRAMASLARTARQIGQREEGIIVNAVRLSTTPVRAIMMPADCISMLFAHDALGDALIAAHQDLHTRFPVTEVRGNWQKIIGYVNFKDIVSCLHLSPQEPSLRGILRPLPRFESEVPVATCLEHLIRDHTHIALVRDPQGLIIGMFTLEDIMEELLGEIHDEYDRLPAHLTASGNNWVAGGHVSLTRLREQAGIELPASGVRVPQTLNEWVEQQLGRPARGGEIVESDSVRVLVRKVRRQLVQEAQISRLSK